ncbi:peptide ABC transporter substrate-binding protein [Lacticaseibacillus jixiensis]|uniref:peptide ABC transporter substrate-binding protein n=1 Tax=Lacticaseibacillus jixiensis TaxID=3231926 RepID=UPI0036F3105D
MKAYHVLEAGVAFGVAVMVGLTIVLHRQASQVDTTAANLRIAASGAVETLDSTTYSSKTASQTIGALIVGLYAKGAKGQVVNAIAESDPQVSADRKTYIFTLRPYHWSNGQRVSAQDFVYAWRRLAAPQTKSRNASRIDFIKNGEAVRTGKLSPQTLGVKALSKTRLQVSLVQANPYLKEILADTPLLPINSTFAQRWGKDYGSSATHILVNGPYRLNGWSGPSDHNWRYVRNPTYYHQARVQVKAIDFTQERDPNQAAAKFAKGKYDYAALSPQQVPRFKGNRRLRTTATTTEALLFFNTVTGPTTNGWLRKAIAQAYDKHAFTQSQLQDGATPLNGLIPTGLVHMANGRGYRSATGQLLPYNLAKATAAWQRAKQQMGVNHLNLTLNIADNDTAVLAGNFLKGQLEHNLPGLHIKLERVTLAQRVALESAGKFELVFSTWTPSDSDPLNLLAFYQTGSRLNISGYTNAKFDQMAAAIEHAGSAPAKRLALVQKAERYLMCESVPAAGFFQDGSAYLLSDHVTRLAIMPTGVVNYEYVRMR